MFCSLYAAELLPHRRCQKFFSEESPQTARGRRETAESEEEAKTSEEHFEQEQQGEREEDTEEKVGDRISLLRGKNSTNPKTTEPKRRVLKHRKDTDEQNDLVDMEFEHKKRVYR